MTPEQWTRVEDVFTAALDVPADTREAWLDTACAGEAWLRDEVHSLLTSHASVPAFLDAPPAWFARDIEDADDPQAIGPYRTIRLLGRGGMGRVYLAERATHDVRQTVALKVMRRGLDTDDLIARFRTERQILARLNHPNIARMFDVGATEQGLPYFVMEYVEGVPILDFCATLSITERLRLFRIVCDAVHYAHRSLVVHRDLKPGNILVTADSTPKLLDFGIAKILDPAPAGSDPGLTRADMRVLTPEYSSPEQIRGGAITTSSDVYSLGILLYQLLAGVHPYGRRPTRADVERAALEIEPPLPSGHAVADSKALRGDLDTIVMKALAKEPEDRYPSVLSLSEDIKRHLDGLPVHARPATLGYRARKFIARNTLAVAGALLLFLILTGSTGITMYQSGRIDQEAARVTRERDKAMQVRAFLLEMFGTTGADQPSGDTVTARQLLDRRAQTLETAYSKDSEMRAEMMAVLAEGYEKLGLFGQAEPLARDALALRRTLYGPEHADIASSLNVLGWLLRERGQLEESEKLLRESVEMGRRVHPTEGDASLARALNDLGVVREARGDYDEAVEYYTESLDMRRRMLGEEHVGVATTTSNLAVVLYRRGDLDEAIAMAGQALDLFRRVLGPDHQRTTIVQSNMAAMQSRKGDHAGAAQQHREILAQRRRLFGATHQSVALSMTHLANELIAADDTGGARALLDSALTINRSVYGDKHEQIANTLRVRGDLKRKSRLFEDAMADYGAALAITRSVRGEGHGDVGLLRARIGAVNDSLGRADAAERSYREGMRVSLAALGPAHLQSLDVQLSLTELLQKRGIIDEANSILTAVEAALAKTDAAASLRPRATRLRGLLPRA